MSKFSEVLKSRNFFCLWLGQIISQLGDRLSQMALIAFVYSRAPGSAYEIAKILSFTIIPVFLIGPIAGVYVDRWDRRKTMYACEFLQMILIFTIPSFLFYTKNMIPIYIIVFISFCIGRFFVPAKLAIIPELVEPRNLLMANSLVNITGMIATIAGFGISGILVEVAGPKKGFYMDSLSSLISGTFIFFISSKTAVSLKHPAFKDVILVSRDIVQKIRKSIWLEIKEGIIYFLRHKNIRFIAAVMFLVFSALGSVYVVLIIFVQQVLQSATKDVGLLIMFLGAGLFAGSMLYGKFGSRVSEYKAIFSALILSGMVLIVFAVTLKNYPKFYMAAFLSFIFGIFVSPILSACNTIIHNVSSNEMMGKVFSSLEMVMHLGFLIFMFISSILSAKYGPFIMLVVVGSVIILLGAINLIYQRRASWLN
ncbi:MAG: MFS transporter [Candidatus Omnitrophota bacterium]|jgi:MFS family permease|nr:MAG: MFS transporter [Candidatus Omnitrophota bacterium]